MVSATATIQDKDCNMPTNKSRRFMFLLFGALYFVQGVIVSYQQNFLKPHMSSEGIDADRLAVLATLALVPFILKTVFGLISDRINLFGLGHRVPYMVLGVLGCSIFFLVAFFVDPSEHYGLVAGLIVTSVFAMALFDTTADAYAIEAMPEEDYGRVQSVMTGGRASGQRATFSVNSVSLIAAAHGSGWGVPGRNWTHQPMIPESGAPAVTRHESGSSGRCC